MADTAVEFSHVWKRFSRRMRVATLAELVTSLPRRLADRRNADGLRGHEFWGLRDVTFTLKRGETLGIIGPNGAGKSTILKLLFRILRADRGAINVHGRAGGLIELGAGFHPMLTGRENVFINGAILGMTRKQIRRDYDSIVEFAELADFMDMPVKNYSSGMFARLAFAIAAHAQPEVLLVDEVLAVGDSQFQVKCYDWMSRYRRSGHTVVMVSHAINVMQSASSVMYLRDGRVVQHGEPDDVVNEYMGSLKQDRQARESETSFAEMPDGRPRGEIRALEFLSADGAPVQSVPGGAPLTIRLRYRLNDAVDSPRLVLALFHDDPRYTVTAPGNYLFRVESGGLLRDAGAGEGTAEVRVDALHLPVGHYRAKLYILEGDAISPIFVQDHAGGLEVVRAGIGDPRALIEHPQHWRILEPSHPGERDE